MTDNTPTHARILALCEEYLSARTEWDEMPEILTVHDDGEGGVRLEEFPVPDEAWHMAQPAVVLAGCAHVAGRAALGRGPVVPPGLVAVAFRYEAFSLSPHASAQAAEVIRRRKAGGSVPRNEHVPGRVEQRIISAVDRQGRQYVVAADRQRDDSAALTWRKVLSEGQHWTGRVPDALDALLQALCPAPTARGGTFGAGHG